MCEKCVEINQTIEHYQRLQSGIGDSLTVERIKEMIAELQARKAELHPE